MIDLKTNYPTQEDFLDGIRRCTSAINEAIGDIQFLAKKFSDGDIYMTEEELANYLRREIDEIPKAKLIRYRPSIRYLYKKSDVDSYIASRAVGKKKTE